MSRSSVCNSDGGKYYFRRILGNSSSQIRILIPLGRLVSVLFTSGWRRFISQYRRALFNPFSQYLLITPKWITTPAYRLFAIAYVIETTHTLYYQSPPPHISAKYRKRLQVFSSFRQRKRFAMRKRGWKGMPYGHCDHTSPPCIHRPFYNASSIFQMPSIPKPYTRFVPNNINIRCSPTYFSLPPPIDWSYITIFLRIEDYHRSIFLYNLLPQKLGYLDTLNCFSGFCNIDLRGTLDKNSSWRTLLAYAHWEQGFSSPHNRHTLQEGKPPFPPTIDHSAQPYMYYISPHPVCPPMPLLAQRKHKT